MSASDRQIQSAIKMLNKSGEPVVIRDPQTGGTGGTDPVTGDSLPPTPEFRMEGLMGQLGSFGSHEVDNQNILVTDGKLLMPMTNPRIKAGWVAEVDGKGYRIMNVIVVRNEAKDIIQKLQIRI